MLWLLVCYVHLLATCLALGAVLTTDWWMLQRRYHSLRPSAVSRMVITQRVVVVALAMLWSTGLLLIALGYAENPEGFFANPKLWVKIGVVVILTLNGVLLHRLVFPRFHRGAVFMRWPARTRFGFAVMGAVSSAAWLYAAFLGIARPWNYTVGYAQMLGIFVALVAVASLVSIALCVDLRWKASVRTVLSEKSNAFERGVFATLD